MPLWLQTQMGYTASWSGLAVAPVSFFPFILSRSVARRLQRNDPRLFASGAFLALAGAVVHAGRIHDTGRFRHGRDGAARHRSRHRVLHGADAVDQLFRPGQRQSRARPACRVSARARAAASARPSPSRVGSREAVHRSQLSEAVSAWDPADVEFMAHLSDRGAQDPQAHAIVERLLSSQSHMLGRPISSGWQAGSVGLVRDLACAAAVWRGEAGARGVDGAVAETICRVWLLTDARFGPRRTSRHGNRRQPTFSDSVLHLPALSGARSACVTAARPASRRHRHGIGRQSRRGRVVAARRGRALRRGAYSNVTLICDPSARPDRRRRLHNVVHPPAVVHPFLPPKTRRRSRVTGVGMVAVTGIESADSFKPENKL